MNTQLEAPTVGVGLMLKEGSRYEVPHHQRDYAWSDDEIAQLFIDVTAAQETEQSRYFLGLIVLIPNDGRLSILDGQQRLATATIIYSSIRAWLRENGKQAEAAKVQEDFIASAEYGENDQRPRMQLNESNDDMFQRYVINETSLASVTEALQRLQRHDPNVRLLEAIIYCRNKVHELVASMDTEVASQRLYSLVTYIRDKVQVVRLVVSSEADAYTMFETLNDRGLGLNVLDLVKNYLFGRTRSPHRLRSVSRRWKEMIASLTSVGGDDFLKAFWTSRHGRTQTAQLFPSIKRFCSTPEQVDELTVDMQTAATQYAALEAADDPVWSSLSENGRDHVRNLKLLGARQTYPILLSALGRFPTREMERLLWLLEILIVRYQLIGGGRTGRLEIASAKLAYDIYTSEITTASQAAASLRGILPSDAEFRDAFAVKQERSSQKTNYLLRYLEREAYRRLHADFTGNEREVPADLTVEHVLPRNPDVEWKAELEVDPLLVEECAYRLGNLCLLTKVNQDLGRKSYEEKRNVYRESTLMLPQHISTYEAWNRDKIEHNQIWMAGLAVDIWRFQ